MAPGTTAAAQPPTGARLLPSDLAPSNQHSASRLNPVEQIPLNPDQARRLAAMAMSAQGTVVKRGDTQVLQVAGEKIALPTPVKLSLGAVVVAQHTSGGQPVLLVAQTNAPSTTQRAAPPHIPTSLPGANLGAQPNPAANGTITASAITAGAVSVAATAAAPSSVNTASVGAATANPADGSSPKVAVSGPSVIAAVLAATLGTDKTASQMANRPVLQSGVASAPVGAAGAHASPKASSELSHRQALASHQQAGDLTAKLRGMVFAALTGKQAGSHGPTSTAQASAVNSTAINPTVGTSVQAVAAKTLSAATSAGPWTAGSMQSPNAPSTVTAAAKPAAAGNPSNSKLPAAAVSTANEARQGSAKSQSTMTAEPALRDFSQRPVQANLVAGRAAQARPILPQTINLAATSANEFSSFTAAATEKSGSLLEQLVSLSKARGRDYSQATVVLDNRSGNPTGPMPAKSLPLEISASALSAKPINTATVAAARLGLDSLTAQLTMPSASVRPTPANPAGAAAAANLISATPVSTAPAAGPASAAPATSSSTPVNPPASEGVNQLRLPLTSSQARAWPGVPGELVSAQIVQRDQATHIQVGTQRLELPNPTNLVMPRRSPMPVGNVPLMLDPQSDRPVLVLARQSQGGPMITSEPMNMSTRPNIVYVEGGAAGVRIEPEQARLLALREGQTVNAVVTQRRDGNVLLIGNQQVPLPARMNLPQGAIALMVSTVGSQQVLSVLDQNLGARLAQRADADARFARLLNFTGSFHLNRLFSPGNLGQIANQVGDANVQNQLQNVLLNSNNLSAGRLRLMVESMGLFGEREMLQGQPSQAVGLKSMLLNLRNLMQARLLDTTSISGAVDELEARQLDSLSQQAANRPGLSWVLPFADQWPVFIELHQEGGNGEQGGNGDSAWSVDMEIGLDEQTRLGANVRVNAQAELALRLWVPVPGLYQLAQDSRDRLEAMLIQQGLNLTALNIYPVARNANAMANSPASMGLKIHA